MTQINKYLGGKLNGKYLFTLFSFMFSGDVPTSTYIKLKMSKNPGQKVHAKRSYILVFYAEIRI